MFRSRRVPPGPAAVVLAAGRSSRMGFPKPLLRIEGRTFLRRILDLYEGLGMPVVLVLGDHREAIAQAENLSGFTVLINPDPEQGQLSSLQLALEAAGENSGILVHPVDHPLVGAVTVRRLLATHRGRSDRILIPEFEGRKGHPVLFPACFFAALLKAPPEIGARWVVRQNPESVLRVPVRDRGILQDIDTPEEFQALAES